MTTATTSAATERVIQAVEHKTGKSRKRVGRECSLLCPAHADTTPSLNIREGDAGYPIIVCRSHGCTPQAVLDAVGLGWGDIYEPNDHWTPHGDAIAHYTYTDEHGEVLFQVLRTASKDFPCRRPDPSKKTGWAWSMGDRRVIYRLPAVLTESEFGGTVYIVEGEKDVEAAERAGLVATCNPGGAGKWRQEYAHWLTGATVVVVADKDEPGREHARTVAQTLDGIAASVTLTEPAVDKKGADFADHLAAGLTPEQLAPFDVEAPNDVTEIVTSEPAPEEQPEAQPMRSWTPINLLRLDAAPTEPPSISGIVYPGRRHVFSGEPESLKSWALLVIEKEEMDKGEAVMHIDHEMGHREMTERLRHLGVTDEQLENQFLYIEPSEPMTAEGIAPHLLALIEARRPTVIAIDAFTGALSLHNADPNSGVDVERYYRTVVDPLRQYGAAVILLDHLPKDKENRGKYSIGSERKVGATDVHLSFAIIAPFGRGENGRVGIHTKKDRPGHLPRPLTAELHMQSDVENGHINYEWKQPEQRIQSSGDFRPTKLMEKVSMWLEENPGEHTRKVIETTVTGKPQFIRTAIDCLLKDGHIEEKSGPNRSRLNTLLKPYREASDSGSSPLVPVRHDDPAEFVSPTPSGTPSHGARTNPQRKPFADTSAASSSLPTKQPADSYYDTLWFDGDPEYDDGIDF